MSNNHQPYRRHPIPATTEHTHPSYSSSSSDHNQHFYRQILELPSPFPSQSSSSHAPPLLPGSDSALNILKSCGLEPTDLSLLAELPEDALTLDSLPHLLKQIKVRREGGQTFATPPAPPLSSSSSSHPPHSSSRQMASTASSATSREWDKLRTQPIQYPLDHVLQTAPKSRPLPPEQVQDWQDRWGNPRQIGSITHQKTSSSSSSSAAASLSSGYVVDYAHKDRPAAGLYDRVGPSSVGESTKKPPSLFSLNVERVRSKAPYSRVPPPASLSSPLGVVDYRKPAPQSTEYMSVQPRQVSPYVGQPSLSQKQPSRKVALDFHGTPPVTYPYTCSLCEITVLSEKYWNSHVNSTRHADGQLTVLQQFPAWDCRLDNTRSSIDSGQSQGSKNQEKIATLRTQPNKPKTQSKPRPATGKVISAKFANQSVDETYLRSQVEPFGKVVKIILFPTLAFVEMGSSDQAKDLVKFYASNPVSAGGQNIIFDHSSTFNFLQSSRVVSFSPGPTGEDNIADLISIIKRFGLPLYTLLLPSVASVEMKFAPDAQKLVDYYSTNILKIDGVATKVFFSGEYNTLMRVPKAKKYEEKDSFVKKRSRTRSPNSARRTKTRSRSPSPKRNRDKEDGGKRMDRETVSSERRTEVAKEKEKETEKKNDGEMESKITKTPQSETAADKPALSGPSQPETHQMDSDGHQEDQVSDDDSDIEGMAVLGEDVDFVDDSDDEREEGAEDGEGQTEEKEEMAEVSEQSTSTSAEPGVSEAQSDQQEVPEEDVELEADTDYPTDLSSCITLDELGGETEEEEEKEECEGKDEEQSTKVLCFKNLPNKGFSDKDFLKIVQDYGKVFRYKIHRKSKVGYIEMTSVFDAVQAATVLSSKTLEFKGCVIFVQLSERYKTLTNGWEFDSDGQKVNMSIKQKEKKRKANSQNNQKKQKEEQMAITLENISEKLEENRERGEIVQEENRVETGNGKEEQTSETGEEENREKIKGTRQEEKIMQIGKEEKTKETSEEKNREEIKETEQEENRMETGEKHEEETEQEQEKMEIGEETSTDMRKPVGERRSQRLRTGRRSETEEKTNETGEEKTTKTGGEEKTDELEKTNKTGGEEKAGETMQEEKPATSEEVASSEPESECPRAKTPESEVKLQAADEPIQPTKPVGTEFVRPVVGYFCNLCQVIYADEDEAKSKHCSTLEHYNKYQEHTGRDPWIS